MHRSSKPKSTFPVITGRLPPPSWACAQIFPVGHCSCPGGPCAEGGAGSRGSVDAQASVGVLPKQPFSRSARGPSSQPGGGCGRHPRPPWTQRTRMRMRTRSRPGKQDPAAFRSPAPARGRCTEATPLALAAPADPPLEGAGPRPAPQRQRLGCGAGQGSAPPQGSCRTLSVSVMPAHKVGPSGHFAELWPGLNELTSL